MIDKEGAMRDLLAGMSQVQRGMFLIRYLRCWRKLKRRDRIRVWQYESKVKLTSEERFLMESKYIDREE